MSEDFVNGLFSSTLGILKYLDEVKARAVADREEILKDIQAEIITELLFGNTNPTYLQRLQELEKRVKETIPEQAAPEPPQDKRKPGRQAKSFSSLLQGTDEQKDNTLKRLHALIDGRRGKEVVLYIKAAIQSGLISLKPTHKTVEKEFGDIGSEQNYDAFMRKNAFTDDELTGAINSLKQNK